MSSRDHCNLFPALDASHNVSWKVVYDWCSHIYPIILCGHTWEARHDANYSSVIESSTKGIVVHDTWFKPFKSRFSASQRSLILEPAPYEGNRKQGSDVDTAFVSAGSDRKSDKSWDHEVFTKAVTENDYSERLSVETGFSEIYFAVCPE